MIMPHSPDPVIVEFVRYHNWANRLILQACQSLSEGQLAMAAPGTYGTIAQTLEHLVRSEAGYVQILSGERPQPPFNWDDRPSVAQMAAYGGEVGEALLAAASGLAPGDLVRQEWEGASVQYQAVALMIQAIDHGIEHRTNITTILAQAGLAPPDVTGWGYLWANVRRLGPSLP
jgi:uncharacterized damage-inducible protein DinB